MADKLDFVFSPFSNKVIDIRESAPDTLVFDPNYALDEKRLFRVLSPGDIIEVNAVQK